MAHEFDTKSTVSSIPVEDLVSSLQQSSNKPEASIYCEELIRRFQPLIYQAWRHAGLEGELSDFVQDVFLRLFKHLPALHNPKAFPGYFRRIVLSAAADQARRQLKSPSLSSVDEAELLTHLVVNLDEAILTGIFVRTYLEILSTKEKSVLTLEFFSGYSADGIAEELRMSPASVRVVKSRALNKLRKRMLEDAEYLEQSSQ